MKNSEAVNYFLGVDGGQSHTTALIADTTGRLLGRGCGGPSNHTREPGGRERLESAVRDSVGEALRNAGLIPGGDIRDFRFHSAHLAMTGQPKGKGEVIQEILSADHLVVGHDAPAALAGALAGEDGIIVIAGTGSVAYGTYRGQSVRIGGRGYLFADEGSAFAMAKCAVAHAIRCEDRCVDSAEFGELLLAHFNTASARDIADNFYAGLISRDQIAAFARPLAELAQTGNTSALKIVVGAAGDLAGLAEAAAARLGNVEDAIGVSFSGGVFRNLLLRQLFVPFVTARLPKADVIPPRYSSEVGALLFAYRAAGIPLTADLLKAIDAGLGFDDREITGRK